MTRKKKICVECSELTYIFSKNRCKSCAQVSYAKTTKRNRIAKTTKKPKKKKPQTITSLKKKLWKIFSQFVRLRDADAKGYCTCITCGKQGFWTKDGFDAGHFRSRRYNSVFIHEKNVHAQCTRCNGYNQGETYLYGKALDRIYGQGTADELVELSYETKKWTTDELEKLVNIYKIKVKNLQDTKNL